MKICRFRPMCFLALIAIASIAAAMISVYVAAAVFVVLCVILWFVKVPKWFKYTAVTLCVLSVVSFVVTTALFGKAAEYRTYDVDSGLRGVILRYTKWYLPHFLSPDNAQLLYSMIFGDKSGFSCLQRIS